MSDETPFNYGGLAPEYSDYKKAKIAILPIPFDGTSTWIKGADKGPQALIEASMNMELYDTETRAEVYKQGIYTADPIEASDTTSMVNAGYEATAKLLKDGKFVVTLGGEHSISFGPIKAHVEKYKNISVLQLDAHTDMRAEYHGDKYNHACVMARATEIVDKVVAVGIRSMDVGEFKNIKDESNIFYAEKIVGSRTWIQDVLKKLGDKVYLTLDLDVFDPSIMSSTGTPEPGGLGWYDVMGLLREVIRSRELVGCDIVELCPSEANPAPDFLAAKLVYKILNYKFAE